MSARWQRLRLAWGALDADQRFAGLASGALLGAMFLPWYEKNFGADGRIVTDSISAFGAVSFVEAAIFLVAVGVLVLVLARGEMRAFHLPGGDGTVIFAAGLWATFLIFYRVFDKPDVSGTAGTIGIQWGFFVAFVAAGALALVGWRMRAAGRAEPPAHRHRDRTGATRVVPSSQEPTRATPRRRASGRPAARDAATEQLSFDQPADPPPAPGEAPSARDRG